MTMAGQKKSKMTAAVAADGGFNAPGGAPTAVVPPTAPRSHRLTIPPTIEPLTEYGGGSIYVAAV